MHLLEALSQAFFRVFGITEPTDATRRRAAWVLLALLLITVGGIATLTTLALRAMH